MFMTYQIASGLFIDLIVDQLRFRSSSFCLPTMAVNTAFDAGEYMVDKIEVVPENTQCQLRRGTGTKVIILEAPGVTSLTIGDLQLVVPLRLHLKSLAYAQDPANDPLVSPLKADLFLILTLRGGVEHDWQGQTVAGRHPFLSVSYADLEPAATLTATLQLLGISFQDLKTTIESPITTGAALSLPFHLGPISQFLADPEVWNLGLNASKTFGRIAIRWEFDGPNDSWVDWNNFLNFAEVGDFPEGKDWTLEVPSRVLVDYIVRKTTEKLKEKTDPDDPDRQMNLLEEPHGLWSAGGKFGGGRISTFFKLGVLDTPCPNAIGVHVTIVSDLRVVEGALHVDGTVERIVVDSDVLLCGTLLAPFPEGPSLSALVIGVVADNAEPEPLALPGKCKWTKENEAFACDYNLPLQPDGTVLDTAEGLADRLRLSGTLVPVIKNWIPGGNFVESPTFDWVWRDFCNTSDRVAVAELAKPYFTVPVCATAVFDDPSSQFTDQVRVQDFVPNKIVSVQVLDSEVKKGYLSHAKTGASYPCRVLVRTGAGVRFFDIPGFTSDTELPSSPEEEFQLAAQKIQQCEKFMHVPDDWWEDAILAVDWGVIDPPPGGWDGIDPRTSALHEWQISTTGAAAIPLSIHAASGRALATAIPSRGGVTGVSLLIPAAADGNDLRLFRDRSSKHPLWPTVSPDAIAAARAEAPTGALAVTQALFVPLERVLLNHFCTFIGNAHIDGSDVVWAATASELTIFDPVQRPAGLIGRVQLPGVQGVLSAGSAPMVWGGGQLRRVYRRQSRVVTELVRNAPRDLCDIVASGSSLIALTDDALEICTESFERVHRLPIRGFSRLLATGDKVVLIGERGVGIYAMAEDMSLRQVYISNIDAFTSIRRVPHVSLDFVMVRRLRGPSSVLDISRPDEPVEIARVDANASLDSVVQIGEHAVCIDSARTSLWIYEQTNRSTLSKGRLEAAFHRRRRGVVPT